MPNTLSQDVEPDLPFVDIVDPLDVELDVIL